LWLLWEEGDALSGLHIFDLDGEVKIWMFLVDGDVNEK
jgi:hypothetical protein